MEMGAKNKNKRNREKEEKKRENRQMKCFLPGLHLYATSINLVVPGHGSIPPNDEGDVKIVQTLFPRQLDSTFCNNWYCQGKDQRKMNRKRIEIETVKERERGIKQSHEIDKRSGFSSFLIFTIMFQVRQKERFQEQKTRCFKFEQSLRLGIGRKVER